MNQGPLEEIDRTLLFISEARERAERAARSIKREDPEPHLVKALEEADRRLLAVHTELMRAAYFPASSEQQLKLAGSG